MIVNKSKRQKLANKAVILRSFWAKMLGLMFKPYLRDTGYVFIFDKFKNVSFHTFFMRFPIDMLFLDSSKKIVDIQKNTMPYRSIISSKAKYVIELPNGSSKDAEKGDTISFK